MSDIIPPENTDLLDYIMGGVLKQLYVNPAFFLQQKLKEQIDKKEHAELIDVPVQHHFAPGVYMRQMDAKAGTLVVSKMHRTEHMNVLLKGSLTIATENGIEFLQAPCVIKSMPGTKRIGYFHEDTSWMTVHPTNETDLDKIEQQVIVPEDQEINFLESIKGVALCHG